MLENGNSHCHKSSKCFHFQQAPFIKLKKWKSPLGQIQGFMVQIN